MTKKILPFMIALFALFAFTSHQGYHVGDKVADFKLKNTDGRFISLADLSYAKGYIVVFTCNHCPFSVAYEDRIIELDKKYKGQGYPVVAINPNDAIQYPDDSYEMMIKRSKEKGFTFPYLHDETQEIARTFGAARTPHVFILKKEDAGMIVKYIGAIDDNSEDAGAVKEKYAEQALDALIADKEPATAQTKAIGCTIKWKK